MQKLLLIVICVAGLNFVSHSQSNNDLIGTWSIDYSQTIAIMSSIQKTQYDSLGADIQAQIKAQLESQTFTFNADSSFSVTVSGQSSYTGTYEVIDSNLQLTYSQGGQMTQVIEQFQSSGMILRLIGDPNNSALIHKIYLKK